MARTLPVNGVRVQAERGDRALDGRATTLVKCAQVGPRRRYVEAPKTSDPATRQRASGSGLWARADRASGRDETRARSLWAGPNARAGGAREKAATGAGSAAGSGSGAAGASSGGTAGGSGGSGAAAAPLAFSLEEYQAPSGSSLNPTWGDQGIDLRPASMFFFNAQVKVTGGTDREAQQWESGGTQTVFESARKGHYVDASGNETKTNWDYVTSLPATDVASGDALPWYRGEHNEYLSTNDRVFSGVTDQPNTMFDWAGPKAKGATEGPKLARTSGRDKFCAWIISRNTRTKEVRYHKWVTWEVDYTSTVNAVAKTVTPSGGVRITGSGAGKGSLSATLKGPRSMTHIRTVWKAP